MENLSMSTIKDMSLRATLISSAVSLENRLKDGTIVIGQEIKFETPFGLRVDVAIVQVKEDKPLIYTYTYSLDNLKFRDWVLEKEKEHLCEGPLAFTCKGIQFMIAGGAAKWDKTAFSIDDEDQEKLFLQLIDEDVVFHAHRDLFAGQEWEILLVTPEENVPF